MTNLNPETLQKLGNAQELEKYGEDGSLLLCARCSTAELSNIQATGTQYGDDVPELVRVAKLFQASQAKHGGVIQLTGVKK